MLRVGIALLFLIFMVLSLYLIKLGGSLPIRTVYGLTLVLFIHLLVSKHSLYAFAKHNAMVSVGLVLALTGTVATLVGVGNVGDALNYTIKWILQPLIIMCLAYQVSSCVGPAKVFNIILLVYGITFLVAVLQGLQLSAAWELKYLFNSFQDIGKEVRALDEIDFDSSGGRFDDASRSRGLSWSSVHLAYQGCLAIGFLFLSYVDPRYRPIRPARLVGVTILVLAGGAVLLSGTRSALVGVLALPLMYWLIVARNKLFALLAISVTLTCVIWLLPMVQEVFNMRALQAQDSSATMRLPLYLFGLELVVDQPWGYGWIDQSTSYAQEYWDRYKHLEGAESIFLRGLHNYPLNVLWVYGVFGLLALAFLFWYMRVSFGIWFLVALTPYLINSLFHNGGIYYGGNYIWVFIGIAKYLQDQRRVFQHKRALQSHSLRHQEVTV